jgi:ubiquitin carboxyl-terminal hydrolase 9/24
MKRFGFDWENNRALKFDDYFKFPLILNMEPYTVDGVNKRESFVEHDDNNTETLINSSGTTGRDLFFDILF